MIRKKNMILSSMKIKMITSSFPLIWITVGDPFGVGPSILVHSLNSFPCSSFLIFGTQSLLKRYEKHLKTPFLFINDIRDFNPIYYNVFEISLDSNSTEEEDFIAGKLSFLYIKKSLELILYFKERGLDPILITGPVSKKRIQYFHKSFHGHSEYLEEVFKRKVTMLMWSKKIKVALVTRHIPLKKISEAISAKKIYKTAHDAIKFLENFKKEKYPLKIRICGLNPHAGEDGLLGDEETLIIKPSIDSLKDKFPKHIIQGPLAPDTAFWKAHKSHLIISMYHDQGLIPFKSFSFFNGFQISLGLPILRLSVSHGTAFDKVNKKNISYKSMKKAIFFSFFMIKNKKNIENSNHIY